MNIKRAIGIIILLCVASLIFTAILSISFETDLEITDPENIPLTMWLTAIIFVGILITLGAVWYFKSPKIVPSIRNGFLFGLITVIMGLISDFLAFVPHKNGLDILQKYFTQPFFWTAFLVILVVSTLVGYIKSKRLKVNS